MTPSELTSRLLLVFSLIGINAFFVTAEFALISVRRSRIRQLVEMGDSSALQVQHLQSSLKNLLSTTQLGITLSSLALGWIGQGAFVNVFKIFFSYLPFPGDYFGVLLNTLAICCSFFLLVYLQIVLGELCPKVLALQYSEVLASVLAAPVRMVARILAPFLTVLNFSRDAILHILNIPKVEDLWPSQISSEELQVIISTETESPGLETEERELLGNIFALGNIITDQIMSPRHLLTTLKQDTTLLELFELVAKSGHLYYPVLDQGDRQIIGIVDFKSIAPYLSANPPDFNCTIAPLIQKANLIPESAPLSDLLILLQGSRRKMAIVVNEFGEMAGVVTLDDILQEILSSKSKPNSSSEFILEKIDQDTYILDSQINLLEFNRLFAVNIAATEEYQTLRGFLLYQWQQIPEVGETISYENLEFEVISAKERRVELVKCSKK